MGATDLARGRAIRLKDGMTDMRRQSSTRRVGRAAIGGLLGVVVILAGNAVAIAADDDDDEPTFEERIIKNIMGSLGVQIGRPDIDYRERSPLVIPPSRELPPPEETASVNNPAWPVDHDLRRPTNKKKVDKFDGTARNYQMERATLWPSELRKGAAPGAGRVTRPGTTDNLDPGRNLSPSELGMSDGGLFNNLFTFGKQEVEPFDNEPPRTSLTQPPTGYQTPSANYPYGIGVPKNNSTLNMPMTKDRAVGTQ